MARSSWNIASLESFQWKHTLSNDGSLCTAKFAVGKAFRKFRKAFSSRLTVCPFDISISSANRPVICRFRRSAVLHGICYQMPFSREKPLLSEVNAVGSHPGQTCYCAISSALSGYRLDHFKHQRIIIDDFITPTLYSGSTIEHSEHSVMFRVFTEAQTSQNVPEEIL